MSSIRSVLRVDSILFANSHASGLLERMKQRKRDFVIKVGEHSFPVHKSIIVNFSDFFEEMFGSETKESEQGFVELQNLDFEAVQQCIDFMYSGQVDVDLASIRKILEAAHRFKLYDLIDECVDFVQESLSPETCMEAISIGRLFARKNLEVDAENFLTSNFMQFVQTDDYCKVEKADLIRYLGQNVGNAEQKWKAVITWLVGKKYSNDADVIDLMKAVNVAEFPFELLYETLWKEFRVQCNETAKKMVLDAIFSNPDELESNITVENFFALKDLAKKKKIRHLDAVLGIFSKFLDENFEAVSRNKRFVDEFSSQEMKEFFGSQVARSCEITKLRFALHWAKQGRNREADFEDLFSKISLDKIPKSVIAPFVEKEPLIMGSTKSRDKVFHFLLKAKDTVEAILNALFSEPSMFTLSTVTGDVKGHALESGAEFSLPAVRRGGCSGIIVVGQRLFLRYYQSMYVLESSGIWKRFTDASNGGGQPLAFQGKLYLFTGLSWHCFDPESESWSTGQCESAIPCNDLNLVSARSFIYCFEFNCLLGNSLGTGRFFPGGSHTRILKVQDYSASFTERCYLAAHKDYIYSFHGLAEPSRMGRKDIQRFNCISNEFESVNISGNAIARSKFGVCIVDAKFYVVGGDRDVSNPAAQDTIEVYNLTNDSWETVKYIDPLNKVSVCGFTPKFDIYSKL